MFPVTMLLVGIAVAIVHRATSSPAAILFHMIAWGMIVETSLLILFPGSMAQKAQMISRVGFMHVVCLTVGGYLTWFSYFARSGA